MPFSLSDEELRKTEQEIGAELPGAYRKAMLVDNGGSVEARGEDWELFPIRNQSSRKLISRTANHILRETKSAQEWPRFTEDALASGANGCGDLLVIKTNGATVEPQVYIWCHEDGSLALVANDFSELNKA